MLRNLVWVDDSILGMLSGVPIQAGAQTGLSPRFKSTLTPRKRLLSGLSLTHPPLQTQIVIRGDTMLFILPPEDVKLV